MKDQYHIDSLKYLLSIDDIRNDIDRYSPSWVKITTITMVSKALGSLDLKKIKLVFDKLKTIRIKKSPKCPGMEWSVKPTEFYNQVTLTYTDNRSTKSIKLFPNGSIQVAGCFDLLDCKHIIKQLGFLLGMILGKEKTVSPDSFRIVMINTNFSLNFVIRLYKITEVLHNNGFDVVFDPDRYSAVIIGL